MAIATSKLVNSLYRLARNAIIGGSGAIPRKKKKSVEV